MGGAIFGIIITLVIISVIIYAVKPRRCDYHSNWSQLLTNFKFSTQEFYKLVEKEMLSHEIDGLYIKDVEIRTSSIFSYKRLYLRAKWRDYYYDLCFAPFGDGCFVSWWLIFEISNEEHFFTSVPFIGGWIGRAFYRKTYYKIDTASMFMTYAQKSVLLVIDEITKETGIRLSEAERKPKINDVFKR